MSDTSINTPAVSEAEALQVVSRGVNREIRTESQRTLGYCSDAVKLQGHNVRKLAQKLEIRAEEKGETFNADSYMSNISNANGIMGLFGFDLDEFKAWLDESPTKSLSAIYKAFRTLFVEPKPAKDKAPKADVDETSDKIEGTPLEVILSLLPHLSAEEREQVVEAIVALETPSEDVAEAA
jgi:hypothetical protein